MPKLRKGDLVIFKARVTDVAPYDGGDQIMAEFIPNGKTIGWCVPSEYTFEAVEFRLAVGDAVSIEGRPWQDTYEIVAMFDSKQVAVKKVGCWPIEVVMADQLKRR